MLLLLWNLLGHTLLVVLLLLLLLSRHHALLLLLLLTLHGHLRHLLLTNIGEVHDRLLHAVLLHYTLLDQGSRPLLRQVLVIASCVATTISCLGLWVGRKRGLITTSFRFYRHIRKIQRVMRHRHRWHIIVCLDIGWDRRRLSRQLRLGIPWKLCDLESGELLLPALVVGQSMFIIQGDLMGRRQPSHDRAMPC